MSVSPRPRAVRPGWAVLVTLGCLAAAALLNQAYNAWIGLDRDDTQNLETTLVYAAAFQFDRGAGALYGPFDRSNPFVLIQAPLYFRLIGVLGFAAVRMGFDSASTALVIGRIISFASFLGLLRLIRLPALRDLATPRPRLAGAVAVLLAAASPVIASFPVTLRPDMPGILLQTAGLCAFLAATDRKPAAFPRLMLAYLCFGLAVCVKQHFIAVWGLTAALLLRDVAARRLAPQRWLALQLFGVAIVATVFGCEQMLTQGMFVKSAFVVPKSLGAVGGGSLAHAGRVFVEILKRSAGLVVLTAAVLPWVPRRSRISRTDAVLLAVLFLELLETAALAVKSSGAWYNYAIQAVVCGCVLAGRAVAAVDWSSLRKPALAMIALASCAFLALQIRTLSLWTVARLGEQRAMALVLRDDMVGACPREQRFFVQLPQYNRLHGRSDLVYDDWLYPAFQDLDAAEPLDRWLGPELACGGVRVVVSTDRSGDRVPGLSATLPELGFQPARTFGPYHVWSRAGAERGELGVASRDRSRGRRLGLTVGPRR